jgi:hypothetical protein
VANRSNDNTDVRKSPRHLSSIPDKHDFIEPVLTSEKSKVELVEPEEGSISISPCSEDDIVERRL